MFESLFAFFFKYSPYVFRQGDFRLAPSSRYRRAGSDGKDIGADLGALAEAMAGTGAEGAQR